MLIFMGKDYRSGNYVTILSIDRSSLGTRESMDMRQIYVATFARLYFNQLTTATLLSPLQFERIVIYDDNHLPPDEHGDPAEWRSGSDMRVITGAQWCKAYHQWLHQGGHLVSVSLDLRTTPLSERDISDSWMVLLPTLDDENIYGFFMSMETIPTANRTSLLLRYLYTSVLAHDASTIRNHAVLTHRTGVRDLLQLMLSDSIPNGNFTVNVSNSMLFAYVHHHHNITTVLGSRLQSRVAENLGVGTPREDDSNENMEQPMRRNSPTYNSNQYDRIIELPDTETLCENSRRFGLEFEFMNEHYQEHYHDYLVSALSNTAWPVRMYGYMHSDGSAWDLKTDSSCGYELASPALRWLEWGDVELALEALREAGANVDERCSVHIHHEAGDLGVPGIRRLVLMWVALEPILFGMMHNSRRNNDFCQTLSRRTGYSSWQDWMTQVQDAFSLEQVGVKVGKYSSLNFRTWWNTGRIEMRVFHGTLQSDTVKYWVAMTQQIVEAAQRIQSMDTIKALFDSTPEEKLKRFKAWITLNQRDNDTIKNLPEVVDSMLKTFA